MFPHRYCEKNSLTSKEDIIDAVIACFKGELPKIVATYVYEDIDSEDYDLLNKVVYLDVQGIFERRSSNFVKRVIQRPTHLEVVVLEPLRYLEPPSFIRQIYHLSVNSNNFQLLEVLTNPSGHIVSQKNLNKLITAYFSAPTTHSQKILITNTEIKSYDDYIPRD